MNYDKNKEKIDKGINDSLHNSRSSSLSNKNVCKHSENDSENFVEYWEHYENLGYVLPENEEPCK
jgi:hypothetical protein